AEAQAKALSNVIQHLKESRFKELATKGDLKELELRMVIKMGALFLAAFGLLRLWPIPVQYVPPTPTAQELRIPANPPTPPISPPSR
ncbi:MAG: hypothetical protein H7839_23280, partial [Magnetococcus sp. YQC-5]